MFDSSLWVFGYGSIIWRPAFPYSERRWGFVRGWIRRFWQASTDHRGVPEAPGLVATLIPCENATCWGMAYKVENGSRAEVLRKLDDRESGGYQRYWLPVQTEDKSIIPEVLVYVATKQNRNFVGDTSLDVMARRIRDAKGQSGSNIEYVLRLDESLKAAGVEDLHVTNLAEAVRKIM